MEIILSEKETIEFCKYLIKKNKKIQDKISKNKVNVTELHAYLESVLVKTREGTMVIATNDTMKIPTKEIDTATIKILEITSKIAKEYALTIISTIL